MRNTSSLLREDMADNFDNYQTLTFSLNQRAEKIPCSLFLASETLSNVTFPRKSQGSPNRPASEARNAFKTQISGKEGPER